MLEISLFGSGAGVRRELRNGFGEAMNLALADEVGICRVPPGVEWL